MNDYTLEALGSVIRQHRKAAKLTQEELGRAVDYGAASAGVSISRLEGGNLTPTDEKLEAIADKLGLTWNALRAEAVRQSSTADSTEQRIARIRMASAQRGDLDKAREDLLRAREQANAEFLDVLRDVAGRIHGADPSRAKVTEISSASDDDVSVEAEYQIRFMRYGVARALDDGDKVTDLGVFAEAVAIGAATAATLEAALQSATARKGLLAAMGLAARPRILPGGGVLAAVAVGVTAAAILDRQQAQRTRLKKETAARLAAAEEDLERTQPNVDALANLIPRATELFEYVALHAGHAVNRWRGQLGSGRLAWESLSPDQQQRYDDFVAIAAAHLAVATVDLRELAESTGDNLARAVGLAEQILEQSREVITSRV